MRPIIILILLAGPMSPASRGQVNEATSDTKPASTTPTALPDVLTLIPADVELAISIPSLAVFDAQTASTLKRLGLSAPTGVLTPVLDWLEIVKGVDRTRSAAMAVWPTDQRTQAKENGVAAQGASRKMALFIPTDSLENLIRFHSPSSIGGGAFRVTIRGRSSWVVKMAGHAIFTTDESTLLAVRQTSHALRDDLTAETLQQWTASEVVVFGNPSVGQPCATLFSLTTNARPWLAPIAELLQRASRWSCAMRFEDNGLAMGVIATTSPPRRNPSTMSAAESGFLGIPLEPIACAFGVGNASAIDRHVIPLVQLIVSSGGASSEDGAAAGQWFDAVRGLLGKLDGFSFSISSAAQATGPPINLAATAKLRGKPERLKRAIASLAEALREGSFTNPRMHRIMSRLALRPAVESAAGVTIDHLVLDTESLEGLNRLAIMDAFGADGLTVRLAIIDDRHLVTTLGGGLDRFMGVVNAVRSGRSPIDANARMIRAAEHLRKDGILEAYVSPSRLDRVRQRIARLIENVTDQPTEERATELVGLSAGVDKHNDYRIGLFLPDDALAGFLSPAVQQTASKSRR